MKKPLKNYCKINSKNPTILVVHKRSAYTEMVSEDSHSPLARLVKENDPMVDNFVHAHDCHVQAMEQIREELDKRKLDAVWRYDFSGLIPDSFDLVLTVGGDGTVLHASHAIGSTPILAINSAPATSVGYFTAGGPDEFSKLLDRVLDGSIPVTQLYRMEVKINGEVVNSRVLNDVLFCHECPASTTRYVLRDGDVAEGQMSSGVWIATAAGSTAAIRAAGGKQMPLETPQIQYAVREPGPSGGVNGVTFPNMINNMVAIDSTLEIRSKSESARLYIDGPHVVIPVNFGDIVEFTGGSGPISLLGDLIKNKS